MPHVIGWFTKDYVHMTLQSYTAEPGCSGQ